MKIMQNQWKKNIARICSAVIVAVMVFGYAAPVQAAEKEYKISFKAGSKGNFDGDSSYTVNRTYGTDISGDVAVAENKIQKSLSGSGYYFTGWSPTIKTTAERRTAYVAQYAKIIDEAVYRINYVDTYGNAVATQKVITTNLNAEAVAYAENVDGFTVDEASKSVVVDKKDGTEITFIYTVIPNRTTETETVVVPGETITTTVGGGTTTGTGIATAGGTGTTTGGGTAQDTETDALVESPDEDVPLANPDVTDDAQDDQKDTTVKVEDEETPLANEKTSSGAAIWFGSIAAILLILAGIAFYFYKKKGNDN